MEQRERCCTARGAERHACLDALNLQHPEWVLEIHQAYATAGCDLLETNTFGANAFKLATVGLQDQLAAINTAGVRLARQAAQDFGRDIWVAGSIGPLGVRLVPYGRVKAETAASSFRCQIEALVEAGVDLLLLETFTDLRELCLALEAAHVVCDLPVATSLTFTRDDRTLLGDTPEQAAATLRDAGADLLGANCSEGLRSCCAWSSRCTRPPRKPACWPCPTPDGPSVPAGGSCTRPRQTTSPATSPPSGRQASSFSAAAVGQRPST